MRRCHGKGLALVILLTSTQLVSKQASFPPTRFPAEVKLIEVENLALAGDFDNEYVGRKKETELLRSKISSRTAPSWLCLAGPSGIGKTRTAIEAVRNVEKVHGREVQLRWFIVAKDRSGTLRGLAELARKVERANIHMDDEVAAKEAKQWLKQTHGWILLLDDVRDLEQIEDLLPQEPRGCIVTTSLDKNNAPEKSKVIHLHRLNRNESTQILQKLTGCTDSRVQNLASVMSGFPLALIQAGALVVRDTSRKPFEQLTRQLSTTRLKISKLVRVRHNHLVLRVLWQEQRALLRNSSSLKLVKCMSLLSYRGVSRGLVERLISKNELTGSLEELQELNLLRFDAGHTFSLHQAHSEVVAQDVLSCRETAIVAHVLVALQQPPGSQWWYPSSFYRVSEAANWHMQSLLDRLGPNQLAMTGELADLMCKSKIAISGYVWYNQGKSEQAQRWLEEEMKKWQMGSLQHAVCVATLAVVVSDTNCSRSRSLGDEAIRELSNLTSRLKVENEVHLAELVHVHAQANILRVSSKDYLKNDTGGFARAKVLADQLEKEVEILAGGPRAHVHNALSAWHQAQEEFPQALQHLQQSERILQAMSHTDFPSIKFSLVYLRERRALLLLTTGRPTHAREASKIASKVVMFLRRVYGPRHQRLARPLRIMGEASGHLGRTDEGRDLCKQAVDILNDTGVESAERPRVLLCAGKFYRLLGQVAEARKSLQEAETFFRKIYGPDHVRLAECRLELAGLACDQGHYEQGIALLNHSEVSSSKAKYLARKAQMWVHCLSGWQQKKTRESEALTEVGCPTLALMVVVVAHFLNLSLLCYACPLCGRFAREIRPCHAKPPALVIANWEYNGAFTRLKFAKSDGNAVHDLFCRAGYDVITLMNATCSDLKTLAKILLQRVGGTKDLLVPLYYCGHGIECAKEMYLVPVDAQGDEDLAKLVAVSDFLPWQRMHLPETSALYSADSAQSPLFIFFLDACRRPVNLSARSGPERPKMPTLRRPSSLARVIYFKACKSGDVAQESDGHGWFTNALLKYGDLPDIDLFELFRFMSADVQAQSRLLQVPEWEGPVLEQPVFLRAKPCNTPSTLHARMQ